MKKEDILKMFPSILEDEIKMLHEEFVVCWYPSSGNHYDAVRHWEEKTKLIPNLFIYSNAESFSIPDNSELIFSKTFEIQVDQELLHFINSRINLEIFPEDHIIKKDYQLYEQSLIQLFNLGFFDEHYYLPIAGEELTEVELAEKRINLAILSENSLINIDELLEKELLKLRNQQLYNLIDGTSNSILSLNCILLNKTYFLLVQSTNENMFNSFVEAHVKIDCLFVNRPCDSFISDRIFNLDQVNHISIEKIGVDELISGKNNGIRMPLSDEYKLVSEFPLNNEPFVGDIGVLYSRVI